MKTWSAAIAVVLCASCSADPNGSTILVSRQLEADDSYIDCSRNRCVAGSSGREYRNADGDRVVRTAFGASFDIEFGDVPEITCGSETFVRAYVAAASEFEVELVPELRFEDGSAVRLFPDHSWNVNDRVCYEETGRWEGSNGSFAGRSGSYVRVVDRLRVTLTLSDS